MKHIKELKKEIAHLEWEILQIIKETAGRIADSYRSYFVYPAEVYIIYDIRLVRLTLPSCNPDTANAYTEWKARGWTLRIYGKRNNADYEQVEQWFKRVLEQYLDEPPLRKDNPSVEQLLQDLKSSDNYLMNNPLQEEYESVFDR